MMMDWTANIERQSKSRENQLNKNKATSNKHKHKHKEQKKIINKNGYWLIGNGYSHNQAC